MRGPCGQTTKRNLSCSAAPTDRLDLRRAATETMTTMMTVPPGEAVLRVAAVLRGVAPKHATRKDAVAAMSEPLKVRVEADFLADRVAVQA